MTQDELKVAVAKEAIKYVLEDAIVGVGTGSTADRFIDELAKIKNRIDGAVASSQKTADRLKSHGIRVVDLNSVNDLPVYIDGADEITEHLAMIKGGGGALTREKIVAAVARQFVDEIVRGRAAADADDGVLDHVLDRRFGDCLFQFILGHGRIQIPITISWARTGR